MGELFIEEEGSSMSGCTSKELQAQGEAPPATLARQSPVSPPTGGTRPLRATEEGLLVTAATDCHPRGGGGGGCWEGSRECSGWAPLLQGHVGCPRGSRDQGWAGVSPVDHPGRGAGGGKATCDREEDEVALRKGTWLPVPPHPSPEWHLG